MHLESGLLRKRAFAAVVLSATGVALLASTCIVRAEDDEDVLNPGWSDSIGKNIAAGMARTGKMIGLGKPAPPPVVESPSGCPAISILDGTQSDRVMAPGGADNQSVRYQYSLFTVGRECTIGGGRISLKVGAGGRVLLGPAGAAGHFDIPLRVVVYSEVAQKPIESRLFRVSASVPAGRDGAPFQFVSDNLVVPLAAGQTGADYSIKVGFDAKGTEAGKPAKVRRGRHAKTVESASQ